MYSHLKSNVQLKSLLFISPLLIVIFFGLSYAKLTLFSVPGYDEISYAIDVIEVKKSIYNYSSDMEISNFPIRHTNTLNTYMMAFMEFIIPHSYATFILHFGYLIFTFLVLRKVFNKEFAFLFLIVLGTNIYFLHLLGTYISELSVGLLLITVMALSFFDDSSKKPIWLITALSLFILARTINFVFILGFMGIMFVVYFLPIFREYFKERIKTASQGYIWAIIVTSPATMFTISSQYSYYVAHTLTDTAENWQNMIGISSKTEIPLYILNTITHYNPAIVVMTIIVFMLYFFIAWFKDKNQLKIFSIIFATLCMVLFAFSNANTSNMYVVFWQYSVLAFLLAYMLYFILSFLTFKIRLIFYIFGVFVFIQINTLAFSNKQQYHNARSEIYSISKQITNTLNTIEHSDGLFINYLGVAPLDFEGLRYNNEFFEKKRVSFEQLSYSKDLDYYMEHVRNANVLILANKDFLWQDHKQYINLNHYISKIYSDVKENAELYGFYSYKTYFYKNDPERFIEIFIKPYPKIHMPYSHIGSSWLSNETTVSLMPEDIDFSKYQLVLDIEIPHVENFKPPFKLSFLDKNKKKTDEGICYAYGNCRVIFELNEQSSLYFVLTKALFKPSYPAFEFSISDWFYEPFSPKPTPERRDWRELSYKLANAELQPKQSKIVSGVYADNWVQELAEFSVCPTTMHQIVSVKGQIPGIFNDFLPMKMAFNFPEFGYAYDVTVSQVGDLDVSLEIPNTLESDCFKLAVFSDKAIFLPPPDKRKISWHLKKIEFSMLDERTQ